MSASRILLLGEGERDVGRIDPAVKRRPPCDFEGDLPRLVRRLSEHHAGQGRFGYDVDTLRGINARIPLAGRPTRTGGKSKELRNAVLAALQTHATVIALIDARAEEVQTLQRDGPSGREPHDPVTSRGPMVLKPPMIMKLPENPPIAAEEVRRIARLAHLDLAPEEALRLGRELGNILAYMQQLEEVDVAGVLPTAHMQIERLPLRADEPEPSLPRELALREAPRVTRDGFAVPAFVDEG